MGWGTRTGIARKPAVAIVCSSVLVLGLSGCEDEAAQDAQAPVRPVLSMVIADVEQFRRDSYPGRAKAVREVNVGFEVAGKLTTRPVDVGTQVREGDILATLEPEPYLAQIRVLEGERAALEAALSNARTELWRREELLKNDFISQANVDDQIMMVQAAEARIDGVDGALDAARLNLDYTTLVAPFDGTISEVFVENFQNVLAKQPVVRLLDTSRIEMEVSVPESLIGLADYVDEISVTYTSLPGVEIDAKIARIGNEASLTTRTYPVTIVMDQPDGTKIQPGMAGRATASIMLPDDWTRSGIEIPAGAVFSPNGATTDETYVWIIDEATRTVSSKSVELISIGDRGLLVNGLEAGDRIVVAGANVLTEGQQVRLQGE